MVRQKGQRNGYLCEIVFAGCLVFFLAGTRSELQATGGHIPDRVQVETGGDRGMAAGKPAQVIAKTNHVDSSSLAHFLQVQSWSWFAVQ